MILSKSSFNPPHQTSPEGSLRRSCGSQGPTSIKYRGDLCLSIAWHVCFCNVPKLLHFLPFKNATIPTTFSDKHCNSIGQDKNQLTSSARIDQNLNQVDERSPITRASIPRYSNPSGSFQKMCGYPNNWKFLS